MGHRKKLLALCMLTVMLFTGCGQRQQENATQAESEAITTRQEKISDTDGETLIEIFWQTPDFDGILSGEALENTRQYYENLYQQSQADWQGPLAEQAAQQRQQQEDSFLYYTIDNQCQVTGETETYLSLQRTLTQYTGGSQEGITVYGDTFLRENGAYLLFSDLFRQGADTGILLEKIQEKMNQNSSVHFYKDGIDQAAAILQEVPVYYLAEKQLILVFQAGDLAPYVDGPQLFPIDLADLKDILSEEYFYEFTEK